MTKVITYGTYALLHQGHINLLRRAKELGGYLIVGVTSDSLDRRSRSLDTIKWRKVQSDKFFKKSC